MPRKRDGDATAAMKIVALYGLLLFSAKRYRLADLAKRLRCSKQTVLRLVEQIETARPVPVQIQSAIEGGQRYFWAAQPDHAPHVTLDVASIQQLVLCRDLVLHMLPETLRDEISQTIRSTTTLLPDFDRRSEALQSLAAAHPKGVIDYSHHHEIIDTVFCALREHRIIHVAYRNHTGKEAKEFDVAPLQLITFRDGLYVKSRLEEALADPSKYYDPTLAVHRIQSIRLTNRSFVPPEQTQTHHPETFGFIAGDPFRVKVRVDADAAAYVRERVWSADQSIATEADGAAFLEFTATSRDEILSWVLSFGVHAELVEPESLRKELALTADAIAATYRTLERVSVPVAAGGG